MSAKKNYQFSFFFGFARYPLQMDFCSRKYSRENHSRSKQKNVQIVFGCIFSCVWPQSRRPFERSAEIYTVLICHWITDLTKSTINFAFDHEKFKYTRLENRGFFCFFCFDFWWVICFSLQPLHRWVNVWLFSLSKSEDCVWLNIS